MSTFRRWLLAPVLDRLDELENLTVTRADDLIARLNAATDDLAGDLARLRDDLREALAGTDAAADAAVAAVLDRFEQPISRLSALGADEADPVPAPPVEDEPVEGPTG